MVTNTDIAGNITKENLNQEIENIRTKFYGFVDGFFNDQPAKYEIVVEEDYTGNLISIHRKLVGEFLDFIPEESQSQFKACEGMPFIHGYLAFLFPHHRLALMHDHNHLFFDNLSKNLSDLVELGYTPIKKRDRNESTIWGNENKLEVLSALRSPESQVRAMDKRAIEILDILSSHLNPDSYTFAIFTPKHWRKRKEIKDMITGRPTNESDPYAREIEFDYPRLHKVKKLVEVRNNWLRDEKLEDLCKGLPLTRAIGLTSIVKKNGRKMHIPMIDFIGNSPYIIKDVLDRIGISGIIVSSGNSYHFYGFNLLDECQWEKYIKRLKSLKFESGTEIRMGSTRYDSVIDRYWPDLQLNQKYSMLRITPVKGKLFQPCFYEYYGSEKTGTEGSKKLSKILLKVA